MPSTYAHRRFGANVLDHLPAPLRKKLEAHRELYDIGLHGPDLLFYYHAEKSTPVAALGNAMHDEPGRTFFDRARRVVHEEADREAALAYALGFVCHFALDSTCHPIVELFFCVCGCFFAVISGGICTGTVTCVSAVIFIFVSRGSVGVICDITLDVEHLSRSVRINIEGVIVMRIVLGTAIDSGINTRPSKHIITSFSTVIRTSTVSVDNLSESAAGVELPLLGHSII